VGQLVFPFVFNECGLFHRLDPSGGSLDPLCRLRRRLSCFQIRHEFDLVAQCRPSAFERLVKAKTEIAAIKGSLNAEAAALVAPGIFHLAAVLYFERHRLRDASDGQIPGNVVFTGPGGFDFGAFERDLGIFFCIEEIRRLQMAVPARIAGIDAIHIDLNIDLRICGLLIIDLDGSGPFGEAAMNFRHHEVPDVEL
jgi:hypothetical protein